MDSGKRGKDSRVLFGTKYYELLDKYSKAFDILTRHKSKNNDKPPPTLKETFLKDIAPLVSQWTGGGRPNCWLSSWGILMEKSMRRCATVYRVIEKVVCSRTPCILTNSASSNRSKAHTICASMFT